MKVFNHSFGFLIAILLALVIGAVVMASSAHAQGVKPDSTVCAHIKEIKLVDSTTHQYVAVVDTSIRTFTRKVSLGGLGVNLNHRYLLYYIGKLVEKARPDSRCAFRTMHAEASSRRPKP